MISQVKNSFCNISRQKTDIYHHEKATKWKWNYIPFSEKFSPRYPRSRQTVSERGTSEWILSARLTESTAKWQSCEVPSCRARSRGRSESESSGFSFRDPLRLRGRSRCLDDALTGSSLNPRADSHEASASPDSTGTFLSAKMLAGWD